MKKNMVSFVILLLSFLILSTCASVNSQGIRYFVGKSESDLIKHFGYNGTIIESLDSEYDKILFFTNRIFRYQMNKTEYIRYKVSRQSVIIDELYFQFQDGCLVSQYTNNGQHYYKDMYGNITRHVNDNSSLVPIVNQYNSIRNRNDSYPNSQRSIAFDRSRIGDTYYLYHEDRKLHYSPDGNYTSVILAVWRIDVVAEDRPETESWIVAIYDERFDRWLSGNGSTTITQERANAIVNEYVNNGFTRRITTEGHSLFAYIKNDKIIKVEEGR